MAAIMTNPTHTRKPPFHTISKRGGQSNFSYNFILWNFAVFINLKTSKKMKRVILIIGVVLTSLAANAQNTVQNSTKNEKIEYSYLWGIFKSKDYPKGKSVVFEVEKPEFSTSLSESAIDSAKYEQKSILWGAVQWTEKKRNTLLVNP